MKKLYMFSVSIFDAGKYVVDIDVVASSIKKAKDIGASRMQERYPKWTVTAKSAYKKGLVC